MRQDPSRRLILAGPPLLAAAACVPSGPVVLPEASLLALEGLRDREGLPVPGIGPDTFRRGLSLLNIWASWCPYCRGEHGILDELSADPRLRLVGVVWQDTADKAAAYLRAAGNPFHAVALDERGVLARAVRQRGVPGSYLVDRTGTVILRRDGALSPEWAGGVLKSRLAAAM